MAESPAMTRIPGEVGPSGIVLVLSLLDYQSPQVHCLHNRAPAKSFSFEQVVFFSSKTNVRQGKGQIMFCAQQVV